MDTRVPFFPLKSTIRVFSWLSNINKLLDFVLVQFDLVGALRKYIIKLNSDVLLCFLGL